MNAKFLDPCAYSPAVSPVPNFQPRNSRFDDGSYAAIGLGIDPVGEWLPPARIRE